MTKKEQKDFEQSSYREEDEYGEIIPESEAAYEELGEPSDEEIEEILEEFRWQDKPEEKETKQEIEVGKPQTEKKKLKAAGLFIAAAAFIVLGLAGVLYGFFFRGDSPSEPSKDFSGQNMSPQETDALTMEGPLTTNSGGEETDAPQQESSFDSQTTLQEDTNIYQEDTFLDSEEYPGITELIEKYYAAYQACDLDALYLLVDSNGGFTISQDMLEERAEIVEYYDNISCSILNGPEEGTFVVYVFYEMKFYNIETLAPTLTRFYVVEDENGFPHIYNGGTSAKVTEYLESLQQNRAVIFLTNEVNSLFVKACRADEKLEQLMRLLNDWGSTQEET